MVSKPARWTAARIASIAGLWVVTLSAAAYQLYRSGQLMSCFMNCSPSQGDMRTGAVHLFAAFAFIAIAPAAVGMMRADRRWLVGAVLVAALGGGIAFWSAYISNTTRNAPHGNCDSGRCDDQPGQYGPYQG